MHVMGTALSAPGLSQVAREAVARITARGGTLSFDPNLRPEILDTPGLREALDEVLAQTNLFLPSGEEIYLFTEARRGRSGRTSGPRRRRHRDQARKPGSKPLQSTGRTDVAALLDG